MIESGFERVAGVGEGGLPAVGEDSRAVALYYAQEDHRYREVGQVVRSFQRMWWMLAAVCALSLYFSSSQIEHNQRAESLHDVDRIITALKVDVGQIGLGPPITYRDLSAFSPAAPIMFNGVGVSDNAAPNSRSETAGGTGVNPSSAVIGTHLLGRFAVRLAPQSTCVLAAFSGAPEKSFNVSWLDRGSHSVNVTGNAISLIKFERNCPGEMLAPPLIVINADQNDLLGVPRSYGLVLSHSMSVAATDSPYLDNSRPLPFGPGPGLLSNYNRAARHYIPDPEIYDLYDFETAKESLAAWATRITGQWYSPLDYQFAVRDLLNAGLARQAIFVGDRNYVGLSRAAFIAMLALTVAMWRRIRFISRVGIPRLRSWLLVDVADLSGLVVAGLYVISVPLMVGIVYAAYGEAKVGALSSFARAMTLPRTYGSFIMWFQEVVLSHLQTFWGLAVCTALLLEVFALVPCVISMTGLVAQARRQALNSSR